MNKLTTIEVQYIVIGLPAMHPHGLKQMLALVGDPPHLRTSHSWSCGQRSALDRSAVEYHHVFWNILNDHRCWFNVRKFVKNFEIFGMQRLASSRIEGLVEGLV